MIQHKIESGTVAPWWRSKTRTKTRGRRFTALIERGWTEHECRHGLYYVPPGLEPLCAQVSDGWRGSTLAIVNGLAWATVALLEESDFELLVG
jgi:hypothetical protein